MLKNNQILGGKKYYFTDGQHLIPIENPYESKEIKVDDEIPTDFKEIDTIFKDKTYNVGYIDMDKLIKALND